MFEHKMTPLIAALLCLFSLTFYSCQEDGFDPIKPSEITKQDREDLGDRIFVAIKNAPEEFPVIPNIPPYDTSVYYFVQRLYDQVSNPIRHDNRAATTNQWDKERSWKITVLDLEDKDAFTLPGGYLFITKGMLLHLKEEFELYYVLAFEATLIDEKYLLTRLINSYNTEVINDISNGVMEDGVPTALDLADVLSNLEMEAEDVLTMDQEVAELICKSSVFDRKGIISILQNTFDDSMLWLNKKNYLNRSGTINSLLDDELNECGDFQTNGNYQRYILDILE